MHLPNSEIGRMLRQRKKGLYHERLFNVMAFLCFYYTILFVKLNSSLEPGFGPGMSLGPFSGIGPTDTYSDLQPSSSIDLDTTRPDFGGLDESHRPSVDSKYCINV